MLCALLVGGARSHAVTTRGKQRVGPLALHICTDARRSRAARLQRSCMRARGTATRPAPMAASVVREAPAQGTYRRLLTGRQSRRGASTPRSARQGRLGGHRLAVANAEMIARILT